MKNRASTFVYSILYRHRPQRFSPGIYNRHRQTIIAAVMAGWLLVVGESFAQPLVLQSVTANPAGTELYLQFSENLCPAPFPPYNLGATHIANYTGVGANSATLLADQRTVMLTLAPALATGPHTLTVNSSPGWEIYSCSGISNSLATPVNFPFSVNTSFTGPIIYYTEPTALGADCGGTVTVHGAGFLPAATLHLWDRGETGTGTTVSGGGTMITATFGSGTPDLAEFIYVDNGSGLPQKSPPFGLPVVPLNILASWPFYTSGCGSSITLTASGSGFCPGATFKAVGPGSYTVVGTAVTIGPFGDEISGIFDFSSAPPGPYNLEVSNGGTPAISPWTFYDGGLSAWQVYPNRRGNCAPETLTISGAFCAGDSVRLTGPGTISGTGVIVTPTLWAADMSAVFNLVGAAAGVYHVEAQRGASGWVDTGLAVTVLDTSTCPLDIQMVGRTRVGYTKDNTFTINAQNLSCGPVGASTLKVTVPATTYIFNSTTPSVVPVGNTITWNVPPLGSGATYQAQVNMRLTTVGDNVLLDAHSDISGCDATLLVLVAVSQDPNYKTGLAGVGANHAIVGNETLPYEIHFENLPTASAPAQDVFVTDRLNPGLFDLSTFSLGDITFGNHVVTPPGGLTSYSTIIPFDVDGNPATQGDEFLVDVEAALITDPANPDYGRVTCSYRSLDPFTLATPIDVDNGFLPPNQFPPLGEGSVKFTVKPHSGLALGTQFGTAAEVIFDSNLPLFTNPWFNTIGVPVQLSVAYNLGQIQITWPGNPGDWTLEENNDLTHPSGWSPVATAPVSIAGGLQQVTLDPIAQQLFFRLLH
jgi:hypothetical protein